MRQYGATAEHFAKIGTAKPVNNPYAQFQTEYSLADILAAPMISDPVTKLRLADLRRFGGSRRPRKAFSIPTGWPARLWRSSDRR